MRNSKRVAVLAILVAFTFASSGSAAFAGQASGAVAVAKAKDGVSNEAAKENGADKSLAETISFRFDIAKLVTNHQFDGQVNSFHVEYEYSGTLEGGGIDPKGHAVWANSFPYFQLVRDDIVQFAKDYADKADFYELFGTNICRFILQKYPQIRKITLVIDIPAYKDVDVDRGATIVMVRRLGSDKK